MTDSMVERVARAIEEADWQDPKVMARVAIAAMRQPTNNMIRASMLALHDGKKNLGWSKKERSVYLPAPTKVVMRWNAMIDAALMEEPTNG